MSRAADIINDLAEGEDYRGDRDLHGMTIIEDVRNISLAKMLERIEFDIEDVRDIAGGYNGKFLKKSGRNRTFKFQSAVAAEDFEDAVGNHVPVVKVSKDGRDVTVELS